MKRLLIFLAAALALCGAACLVVMHFQSRQPPAEWLGRRFDLEGETLSKFVRIHEEYSSQCSDTCLRIMAADQALASSVRQANQVTPEIKAAIEAAAQVDAECRANMLRHFYEASALLPENRRDEYLRLVMPLVLRGAMNMELRQP